MPGRRARRSAARARRLRLDLFGRGRGEVSGCVDSSEPCRRLSHLSSGRGVAALRGVVVASTSASPTTPSLSSFSVSCTAPSSSIYSLGWAVVKIKLVVLLCAKAFHERAYQRWIAPDCPRIDRTRDEKSLITLVEDILSADQGYQGLREAGYRRTS